MAGNKAHVIIWSSLNNANNRQNTLNRLQHCHNCFVQYKKAPGVLVQFSTWFHHYCTHMHPCNIFSHYIYLQNCFKVLLRLYANDKTYAKINSSRTACLKTLRAAKESTFLDFSTLSCTTVVVHNRDRPCFC